MALTDLLMIGLGINTRGLRDGERALGRLQSAGNRAESALGRMASMLAVAFSANKIMEYADAYTNLQNRLKLVTDGTNELARATQNVIDIARNSRQALGATGDLYFKISQNAGKLGLSVADVSRVTETFGKTLALSGASTQGAEAAILQFSQALASGVIRGDEFNSVAENAPAALDALARALGVGKGELRKYAAEGRLTADVLIQAFKEQSEEVDKLFGKTESTISQAFVGLKNSIIVFVGQLNEATASSKGLVSTLEGLSQWLDSGALFDDIIYQTKLWGYAFDDVGVAVDILNAELKSMGVDGGSILDKVGTALKTLPTDFTALVKLAAAEWRHFSDTVAEGMIIHSTRRKEIDDAYKTSVENILNERDARISASGAAVKAIQDERKARKQAIADKELSDYMDMLAKPASKTAKELFDENKGKAKETKKTDAQKAADQLQDNYKNLAAGQKERIDLWGQETELAKINFALKNTELSKLLPQEKELLRVQAQKLDALQAEKDLSAQQKEVDSFMAGEAQQLDELRSQYATENEIIAAGYRARQAIIDEALAREKISKDEARELTQKNDRQVVNEKRQLEVQKLGVLSQGFGNIATLMQSENRKLFEIGKAAALAQAFVNTATAITNALAVQPYPLGLALATTAGVAGAVQIAAIQNQQISGARAMGGNVQAGKSYLVGERGAEVVTMGGSGHVTPNHALGGDSKITIVNQTTGRIDEVKEQKMPDGERVLIIMQARDLIANEMRDPNSKTSRSMQQSLTVQRRR